MQSKELLILGGSFNPPHKGHELMVREIVKLGLVDGILLLGVGEHDFEKKLVAADHRLAMLKLMLSDIKKELQNRGEWKDWEHFLRIEDHEIRDSGVSCTLNTLEALASQYPQFKFSFLIGSDNLADFHRWYDRQGRDYKELLKAFTFYVYPRAGYPMQPLYKEMIALENVSEMEVSSTQVRELLAKLNHNEEINRVVKEELLQVLNPQVLLYIINNCLYQN